MNNFLTFHTEVTPDGVNIMHRSNDGMTERIEAVSCIDAVSRLDAGDYDDEPDEGMPVRLAIVDGGNQGYFDYASQYNAIMWRWPIATVFVLKMRGEDGIVGTINGTDNPSGVAVYSNGVIIILLYPTAGRLVMASSIEGAMTKRSGIESGTEHVTVFYRAVMDMGQGALTPFSCETLAELHDSFIAELNENGMPAGSMTYWGWNRDY